MLSWARRFPERRFALEDCRHLSRRLSADLLRVGEIQGGWYPKATQSYLSMGCNHCLEPTCLEGCPVDAYTKDSVTGLVRHSADACIGCQYCVQACPYGVRYFDEERGVTDKCTWCYHRITKGLKPACVEVCPVGARVFGDLRDPASEISRLAKDGRAYRLLEDLNTQPGVRFLARRREKA